MTILVGILCQDGVVIGSDSSATFSSPSFPTIEQLCKKIKIIDTRIIIAGTGEVGLGQRFIDIVTRFWHNKGFMNKTPIMACTEICKEAVLNFIATRSKIEYGALMAFAVNGRFILCEFPPGKLQPELKGYDGNLWYVAMGSGQMIADPFLGFIRRIFWKDTPPTNINGGIFAALWTLKHTINLNPGGIQGPPQIGVLKREGKEIKARMLEADELEEHKENIKELELYIGKYKDIMAGKSEAKIPEP